MPHHKHHRNQRTSVKDETNNNETSVVVEGPHNDNQPANRDVRNNRHTVVSCCMPSGCLCSEESIDPSDAGDAVRVVCNNDACSEGTWMHKICFDDWEDGVLAYLKSCGRARSWSEKQRLQNLWTKKGYDLAFKACDCRCGRGHLRKDLDYIPPPKNDNAKKHKKKSKKNDRPMPVVTSAKSGSHNTNHNGNVNHNHNHGDHGNQNVNGHNRNNHGQSTVGNNVNAITIRNRTASNGSNETKLDNANGNRNVSGISNPPQKNSNVNLNGKTSDNNTGSANSISKPINTTAIVRPRTDSLGSTGSSSVISTGSNSPTPSPPRNGNVLIRAPKPKFDTCSTDNNQTSFSNIFRRRHDLTAFNILPRQKQNPYHIKMEDDGPPGNDETRSFVLNHLSTYKVSSLNCVLCMCTLPVFDRYPMIDGTFFLSPQAYGDGVVQVISEGRLQFINAACVNCLEGASNVHCTACKRKWDGSTLLLGSMYSYDIFAAMPCCQKRLTCKHCRRAVVDINNGLSFYSEYSRMIACPYCKAHDYHFIRPMQETFAVKPRQLAQQQPIWN